MSTTSGPNPPEANARLDRNRRMFTSWAALIDAARRDLPRQARAATTLARSVVRSRK